jgi:hypothetical protein
LKYFWKKYDMKNEKLEASAPPPPKKAAKD